MYSSTAPTTSLPLLESGRASAPESGSSSPVRRPHPTSHLQVHPNQKRVFMGANGTLAVGVLPVASFSGGHTYYVQRLYEVRCVAWPEPWAGAGELPGRAYRLLGTVCRTAA
jgi:hypothetical protein